MDSFHGTLTAAAILVLFLIFVALPLIFLRYFFTTGVPEAPAPRVVGTELLSSLPVTVYRTADHVGVLECAVCLAGLQDGEQARFLPRCGHGFHAGCISVWLASRSTCPLCRVTVDGKPGALTPASLPPVLPEPANYAGNLPASELMLGISDQATLGVVTVTSDGGRSALAPAAVMVIDIPESRMVAATPRDESKPPGLLKGLWSFGREGPSASTTVCSGGSCIGTAAHVACATPRAPV